MILAGRWENPEPQTEIVNGKEIITTESVLLCRAGGMEIQAANSGQKFGKKLAEQINLKLAMDVKYPGLYDLLTDPYGSLYLNEGMYEKALAFLADRITDKGDIFLPAVFDGNDLENEMVRLALGRLMPRCDISTYDRFINGLEDTGLLTGMNEEEGWDVHYLNDEMMEMLRKDCETTNERVQTDPTIRWQEENRVFTSSMSDAMTQLSKAVVMYLASQSQPAEKTGENPLKKLKEKVEDQFKKREQGRNASAAKIGSTGQAVQNYTKEDIITALDGVTEKSSEIADALRKKEIGINVIGDELFERYHGCGSDTVAIQVNEQIYVRNSSVSLLSDVVHEGTHALDYYNGISQKVISSWTGETAAYSAERLFQLKSGGKVEFATEEDMMVHIWQNYSRR